MFGAFRIHLQRCLRRLTALRECIGIAAIALEEFRIVAGRITEKRNVPAALFKQMPGDRVTALKIVAANRQARLIGQHRAPAHEAGAVRHQLVELVTIGDVIAVTEQDDAVGLLALGEIRMPVLRQLLERDQQVVTLFGASASDRTQHRQKERIDMRLVGRRILEQQQRQRARMHAAQIGGVLVDLVVELIHGDLDAPPRLLVDQRATAQRPRHRGLGNPGQVGDIE